MRYKDSKAFIAYQGTEYSVDEIVSELRRREIDDDFIVKVKLDSSRKVIFAKVIYNEYEDKKDPYFYEQVLTVTGYVPEEMMEAFDKYTNAYFRDFDAVHLLVNLLYQEHDVNVFSKLNDVHFCSVIYDKHFNKIIAGITKASGKYINLFYGYTRRKHELMFSNVKEVLTNFCDEIEEMYNNTYMINGQIYSLDGKKIINPKIEPEKETKIGLEKEPKFDEKNSSFIKKDKQTADNLIDGLNALLLQVVNDSVREKIEKNVEEYLSSEDSKKKITDYILKGITGEVQKQLLEILKKVMNDLSIEDKIRKSLQDLFNKQLEEYTKKTSIPIIHVIKLKDTELGRTSGGFYHEKFEEVLSLVQLDEPIMLIGPAGSGKNHAIFQISQALGLHMYYTNNASNEFKLTGFIDAGGHYRDTEFYKAFKNGGIFFLDEIDNSDPSALIIINSALANGYMAFPHETIDRHPNFRMVAAANTWGKGSDLQYVGRNALDGATLDRFDNVFFNYDRKLEANLYPNEQVLQFMWAFRDAVEQTKTPHIVSTRGIGKVYKKEINGIPVETILRTNIIRNLGQDDLNTLLGSMRNINNNKYYATAKTLKLGK